MISAPDLQIPAMNAWLQTDASYKRGQLAQWLVFDPEIYQNYWHAARSAISAATGLDPGGGIPSEWAALFYMPPEEMSNWAISPTGQVIARYVAGLPSQLPVAPILVAPTEEPFSWGLPLLLLGGGIFGIMLLRRKR